MVNKKGLVAVVDDELDIAQLFRDALQTTNGFSIFAFTDPKAAFEHFALNKEDKRAKSLYKNDTHDSICDK